MSAEALWLTGRLKMAEKPNQKNDGDWNSQEQQ
jgi:hypothetical protein